MGKVYKLVNRVNNRFYVGSSANIEKRFESHIDALRNSRHHNFRIQEDYDIHGEVFEMVEIEDCQNHRECEQVYIDMYFDDPLNYNLSKHSTAGDMLSYHPKREEIIESISKTIKQKYADGEINLPDTHGNRNPNWRGGVSKSNCETCNKEIGGNAKFCADCYFKQRDITGENNPFYGKKHIPKLEKYLRIEFRTIIRQIA